MPEITDAELGEILAYCERTTGPRWIWEEGTNYVYRLWNARKVRILEKIGKLDWHENSHCGSIETGHNLAFAARSRTDTPRLVKALQADRVKIATLTANLVEKEFALEERDKWRKLLEDKQSNLTKTINVREALRVERDTLKARVAELEKGLGEFETHETSCSKFQSALPYSLTICNCKYAEDNAHIDALLGKEGEEDGNTGRTT